MRNKVSVPLPTITPLSDDERGKLVQQAEAQMVFDVLAHRGLLPSDAAAHAQTELTKGEIAELEHGGLSLASDSGGSEDDPIGEAHAEYLARYAEILARSLSVAQAAQMLAVQPSEIRKRLSARVLYGIKDQHAWRLPRFQFDGNHLVPGIDTVLPQLDSELHPLAVYNWFTLPDPDLLIDDAPRRPRDWLLSGGEADEVAAIAADL